MGFLKKIGYTCGVYELFHVGHLNLFERCKQQCDYLIVGVCDDEYVRQFKDKDPIIGENDRARIVGALKCVDEVHIIDSNVTVDKLLANKLFGFNMLFVGSDWKGTPQWQRYEEQFASLGVEIVYLPHTDGISSTILTEVVKKHLD